MFNNSYLAFAAIWVLVALTPTVPVEVKDANHEAERYIAQAPTPTPTPEPTPEPTSAPVTNVIVREVVEEVTVPVIVVQDNTAAQSATPTPESQTIIERLNPAGKVYGYDKNDKGKK